MQLHTRGDESRLPWPQLAKLVGDPEGLRSQLWVTRFPSLLTCDCQARVRTETPGF